VVPPGVLFRQPRRQKCPPVVQLIVESARPAVPSGMKQRVERTTKSCVEKTLQMQLDAKAEQSYPLLSDTTVLRPDVIQG